ncbi:hypothetical protein [Mucilaginibacter sp.]|uniref:hypothetical protein n=1 Tax=Mucilaginibacter sp. TaxID=1882438 RepID=UPI003D1209EE
MYWCKSHTLPVITLLVGIFLLTGFSSCKPDLKETGPDAKYFDLKGYFKADTARLNKLNPFVLKSIAHNGVIESKKVKIADWGKELDLFIGSDINKPAWKNSYDVTDNDEFLIYKRKDPSLKMYKMVIRRDKQKVRWILIENYTKNSLYETTEKLSYFPDSLYLIEKTQKVRFLGINRYRIQGAIVH